MISTQAILEIVIHQAHIRLGTNRAWERLGSVRFCWRYCWRFCLLLLLVNAYASSTNAAPPKRFIVTITSKLDQGDTRHDYERELVTMLLEKTREEYGDFEILDAPPMSYGRALKSLNSNTYPNFIRGFVYETHLIKDFELDYIPFPLLRGLLGYRTCFISSTIAEDFAKVSTREELVKYSHGYGLNWVDAKIMRNAGIEVSDVPKYKSLFNMVAKNRFDLFCRGTNEVYDEYQRNKNIENFSYDKSKAFFYHFPFFFHTHKSNTLVKERIQKGLEIAYEDGSFESLWWQHHRRNLEFVALEKRQIFYFDNPAIQGLDNSFTKYLYRGIAK